MKKKHELIKEAYDKYPKGIKFKSALSGESTTSCGKFDFGSTGGISDHESGLMVYSVLNGDKWAEIIPESILSGKIVIEVNNIREQNLVNNHFGECCLADTEFPHYLTTTEDGFFTIKESPEREGYKIIPFSDFAAEVGIEVPVFVMTSEDNVPLYVGDGFCECILSIEQGIKIWELNFQPHFKISNRSRVVTGPSQHKAFSTKEAAEDWIKERNKPKSIPLYTKFGYSFKAIKGGVKVTYPNTDNFTLSGEQVEQMYTAYKSLQSRKQEA